MRARWLALATLALGWARADAAISITEADRVFEQANEAHLAGNHQRAVDLYTQLLDLFPNDPILHYNLGNAYQRLGQTGWAVWAYEMALLLRPGWDEARHNLALVRPTPPPPPPLLARPFLWARDEVAPRVWSWVALGAWALMFLAGAAALRVDHARMRRGLWRLTALALAFTMLALAALALQWWQRQAHPASIVVAPSATVRSGAGPEAGSLMGELPAGARVWEVAPPSDAGWVKIRTEAGQLGFVDQGTLRPLTTRGA